MTRFNRYSVNFEHGGKIVRIEINATSEADAHERLVKASEATVRPMVLRGHGQERWEPAA